MNRAQAIISRFSLLAILLFSQSALAADINVNDVVNGTIAVAGETDEYTFNATAGQSLFFDRQAGGMNAIAWVLLSPSNNTVFSNPGWRDAGPISIMETGLYTLRLTGNGGNIPDYQFQIVDVPPDSSTNISIGDVVNGSITVQSEADEYLFEGSEGQLLFFDRQNGWRNGITWRFISPTGIELFRDTTWSDRGPLALVETGQYTLRMVGNGDDLLDYQFQLHLVPEPRTIPAEIGAVVSGELTVPGQLDFYTFTGMSGQIVSLEKLSGTSTNRFYWVLYGPDGSEVDRAINIANTGQIPLPDDGQYTLEINGAGDGIGPFAIRVWDVPGDTPKTIALDTPVSEAFSALAERQTYLFEAVAGQDIVLDINLNPANAIRFDLHRPDGTRIFRNKTSNQTVSSLPLSGTYTLTAHSIVPVAGYFNFQVASSLAPLPFPPSADLVVTSISNPARVVGNPAAFDISWTVSNVGTAATNSSEWTDRIEFRGQNDFVLKTLLGMNDTDTFTIAAQVNHSGVLAPGESYTQTATFGYQPAPDYQGAFDVVVMPDADNAVFEDMQEDNSAIASNKTAIYPQPRLLSGDGAIRMDLADGSVLPAGVEFSLAGQANFGGGAVNVVFILDVSLSTNSSTGLDANGDGVSDALDDLNGDGSVGDILDTEIGAILRISDHITASADDVLVAVVPFDNFAGNQDLGPDEHTQVFQHPDLEKGSSSVSDLETALGGLRRAFGTNFQAALQSAGAALNNAQPADQTLVFFLTDGEALVSPSAEEIDAFAARGMRFFAYQIGNPVVTNSLNALVQGIDANAASSATGTAIVDPNDLVAGLLSSLNLVGVNINGAAVDVLDAEGVFFTPVTLSQGPNPFNIEAFDSDGNSISKTITLIGAAPGDLVHNQDITGEGDIRYRNTRYNRASGRVHVDAFLTNTSPFVMRHPVQAALDIRPPAATLQNAAGTSATGRPLIIFDDELTIDGLGAADTSAAMALKIANPREDRVSIDAVLMSLGNNPPAFTSLPAVLIDQGLPYAYAASASDVDADPLIFSLSQAPTGMALNPNTGAIDWLPTAAQLGVHPVELKVDDSRGGVATQAFQVSVSSGLPDLPPVITSTATTVTTRDTAYLYDVRALDPEGDVLTYFLDSAPTGMSIDASSGVIRFNPVLGDVGVHAVAVRVTDPGGNAGHQSWDLTVRNENQPPLFMSTPVIHVAVGEFYRYRAVATDDGDAVTYSLQAAPTGMSIDANTGTIRMTPGLGQTGLHTVVVQAQDDLGASTEQAYLLNIGIDSEPPAVSVVLSRTLIELGGSVDVNVLAVDNLAVETMGLFVDGVSTPLSSGMASVTPSTSGLYQFRGTATDANGNAGEDVVQLRVIDPADDTPPVITITAPQPGGTLGWLTDVTGSVIADDLEFYRVEFAPQDLVDIGNIAAGNPHWRLLAESDSELSNGLLATFDPTVLRNDGYVIRVVAQDFSGNIDIRALTVFVAANARPGRFSLESTDLSMPLAGIPIKITRRYDSFSADMQGDFGYGWSLSIGNPDLRETLPVAPSEALVGLFAANAYTTGTRVYLNNPDGERVGFTFEPTATGGFGGTVYHPQFTPDPGVTDRLEVDDIVLSQKADGSYVLALFGFNYNPENFRLIRPDGVVYHYNQFAGLQRVGDSNGNELTITDAGVFHSSGAAIPFARDAQGRITRITDPDGGLIDYQYDASGDLTSVAYQDGLAVTYRYLDSPAHYIDEVTDPTGRYSARYEYDASGRIVAVIDAAGNRTEQFWDPANFSGAITDGNGNRTEFIYDQNGNILEETDPLGGTRQYTYDVNNNRTLVIDENGNTTAFTYDDGGNRLSKTDALGGVLTYTYDGFGNRTGINSQRGDAYLAQYDSSGNALSVTNPLGGVISSAFDAQGRMVEYSDANGNITTYEYDTGLSGANRIIDPLGGEVQRDYNWFGAITRQLDASGAVTEYTYDSRGNLLSERDAAGNETVYAYSNGLMTAVTDPNGNIARSEYDDAGRLTATTDGSGNTVRYGYDANGNRVSVIDPSGNITLFAYDALNRLVQKTDPLGSATHYAYDAVDNLVQIIDRNGREKRFEYDAVDRQIKETWLDGGVPVNVINTVYDAVGNPLSVTDNSSVIEHVYDALDRITSTDVTGTAGLPPVRLSYTYDANHNRRQVSDNLGVTLSTTYDELNRPVMRVWQGLGGGSQQIDLSYDGRSKLLGVNRSNAGVPVVASDFTYDAVGRINGLTHANNIGVPLASYFYSYDSVGLLTSQTHHGETVDYLYDNSNQLVSADSSRYGLKNYAYDASGNPDSGVQVTTAGNRLLTDGRFDYQYDAEGNLVRKTDIISGDYHNYSWDHRNRLTRAEQRAADTTLVSESVYSYDALDRRMRVTVDGVATATVYDGDNAWGDFDALGNVDTHYLFGDEADELLARSRSGNTDWYLTDRLGSVRDIINGQGTLLNQIDYDSFGYVLAQTAPAQGDRYRFTGREQDDASGLYYYRARYYDPVLGRFISEDPINFESGDYNFYRYVNNSPQNATDPSGEAAAVEYGVLDLFADTCTLLDAENTGRGVAGVLNTVALCLSSAGTDEGCNSKALLKGAGGLVTPVVCGQSMF